MNHLQLAICNLQALFPLLAQVPPADAESFQLTADPLWSWWLIAAVAVVLIALTWWTYRGVPNAGNRRVSVILLLRLAALFIALLALARPSVAVRDEQKHPSLLIIVLDQSESMTIQDAHDNHPRWEALQQSLKDCGKTFKDLAEQNVTVKLHAFDAVVRDYDEKGKADGQRSDYGSMLHHLGELYGSERHLRGLLVVGDGADNGTRFVPGSEAEKWRARGCPVSTFVVGLTTTSSKQRDVVLTAITPEPSPVPVKGKLTVKVLVDAPGFEGQPLHFHLYVDDKETIPVVKEIAKKPTGNEVKLVVDAPDKPGEIKVTVKVDQLPGEVTPINNEISTFVTVTKEGLSILYVGGRLRPEQAFIGRVLRADPRIRLFELNRASDAPLTVNAMELFQFDKQHYDVIVVGDLTAKRLSAGNPQVLQRIHDLVSQKGTGFLMMGGFDTFGKDWAGTPIATLLPVEIGPSEQLKRDVKMVPKDDGLRSYILRLSDNADDNKAIWDKLPTLNGMNGLGPKKRGASVLAEDAGTNRPILVSQQYGKGRVLAFAGDTTQNWLTYDALNTQAGVAYHARFWKQLALWLAQQEESTGNVWARLETRRLPAGGKQTIEVGIRGKGGIDLDNGKFDVKVINPKGVEEPVTVLKEGAGQRGTFWKTEHPGEYKVMVKGTATDTDGKTEISDETTVRFMAYQEVAELSRQAADHDFMARLANAGGGKAQRLEDIRQFLLDVLNQPLPTQRPKLQLYPDWRGSDLSPILPFIILLFVMLLSLEWFLRRRWGLV